MHDGKTYLSNRRISCIFPGCVIFLRGSDNALKRSLGYRIHHTVGLKLWCTSESPTGLIKTHCFRTHPVSDLEIRTEKIYISKLSSQVIPVLIGFRTLTHSGKDIL